MRQIAPGPRTLALATVLLLASGTAGAISGASRRGPTPGADRTVQLAGVTSGELGDATTTMPPTTTPPPTSAPTTITVARSSTTTVTAPAKPTVTPTPAPKPATGVIATAPTGSLPEPACAQLPAGIPRSSLRGGQWLARRVDGGTANFRMYIEALPCDLYDGEGLQMNTYVAGPQATLEYTIDYGDGASWYQYPYDPCTSPFPGTWMGPAKHHVYAQPGIYTVTVQITVHPCAGVGAAPAQAEKTSLSIPVERVAGVRPYPTPELPKS